MKKIILLIATILFALTPQEYLKIGTQEAIYDAANEYYKMKEYKKAIELYKKINKPSLKFQALYNLGNAYAKSFEFKKAIKAYKEALEIKKDKDALYNLKLIEKLLKKKNTHSQKKMQKNLQKHTKNQSKKENKKQQKIKNPNNKSTKDRKKEKSKQNNQNKKSKSLKGKIKPYPHKENLKQFKTIKNAKTTDIRKRYYMNRLKEMKFNTLLLPLRSEQ